MPKYNETRTIDEGTCPACGKKFNAWRLLNGNIDNPEDITCPQCGVLLRVLPSVEYMVQVINKDGELI